MLRGLQSIIDGWLRKHGLKVNSDRYLSNLGSITSEWDLIEALGLLEQRPEFNESLDHGRSVIEIEVVGSKFRSRVWGPGAGDDLGIVTDYYLVDDNHSLSEFRLIERDRPMRNTDKITFVFSKGGLDHLQAGPHIEDGNYLAFTKKELDVLGATRVSVSDTPDTTQEAPMPKTAYEIRSDLLGYAIRILESRRAKDEHDPGFAFTVREVIEIADELNKFVSNG